MASSSSENGKYNIECNSCGMHKITTQNEPREPAVKLNMINDGTGKTGGGDNAPSDLWNIVPGMRVNDKREMLPMTHPARFEFYVGMKRVEETLESKERAMPVVVTHTPKYIIYEWKIRDDRGVHNALMSELKEFSLKAPNGRLVMHDPITKQSGVHIVPMAVVEPSREVKEANEYKESVTYGGRTNEKNAYVYLTFERPKSPQMPPLKKINKEGGSEDDEESEEEEEEEKENSEDSAEGDYSEALRARTLTTITIIAPFRKK